MTNSSKPVNDSNSVCFCLVYMCFASLYFYSCNIKVASCLWSFWRTRLSGSNCGSFTDSQESGTRQKSGERMRQRAFMMQKAVMFPTIRIPLQAKGERIGVTLEKNVYYVLMHINTHTYSSQTAHGLKAEKRDTSKRSTFCFLFPFFSYSVQLTDLWL